MREEIAATGETPLAYMVRVMRDAGADMERHWSRWSVSDSSSGPTRPVLSLESRVSVRGPSRGCIWVLLLILRGKTLLSHRISPSIGYPRVRQKA
jgi:hypothetical protein